MRSLLLWCLLGLCAGMTTGLRPLRGRDSATSGVASTTDSWADEKFYYRREDNELSSYPNWNVTGTFKGTWRFRENENVSSRYMDSGKSNGVAVLELVSTPTKINGVHLVQGAIILHDVLGNAYDPGDAHMRVDGVYTLPFRQLRLVINSGIDEEAHGEKYFLSHPFHLPGIFSSPVFQESTRDVIQKRTKLLIDEIEKHCNLDISAKVSRISSGLNDGDHELYNLEGHMESLSIGDDNEVCFSSIELNVTSLNIEHCYNKAVNYSLMVTLVSFLQVLLLIRQMEHSNTQSGAAKVSILMIGQQAIMDAYLCLLHLTAGILVESLFNAFATAAFFKLVVFSIFEMRYLLFIWKASRPMNTREGWETVRRELSVLYGRFYGIFLGGIFIMYELHNFLRPIFFVMYSFWIPQIVFNVMYETRKPLHPYYVVGVTVTRLAIPFYVFGCPSNFMRHEVDGSFCKFFGAFVGLQAVMLLLQNYLGSRWFIPRQILPEKYDYCRKIENATTQAVDCVICMTSIDLTHRSDDLMVTPCDHYFHSGCLERWMDVKMECPTCRRPLPPA